MKIYVASSWRNPVQPEVITNLKQHGYNVYDFRNPSKDDDGFHWSDIDVYWKDWDTEHYRANLQHPIAKQGFKKDFDAMKWADVGIMVMPCGRSAHLEAGYFVGAGKPLLILIPEKAEPELMYAMAYKICKDIEELMDALKLFERRFAVAPTKSPTSALKGEAFIYYKEYKENNGKKYYGISGR